ncbi:hypothetical protein SDC9_123557 [bioreactor metagenome]|uniref:Uncharacterized protein n=1 Tax=bioreactor metagenome TaxID=1076179 RepID=A0A645CI14_9ZZZZ
MPLLPHAPAGEVSQPLLQMGQQHPPVLNEGQLVLHHPLFSQRLKTAAADLQLCLLRLRDAVPRSPQPPQQLHLVRYGDLRRVGGGGRPHVRYEIGNRHVRLMAHGGDHRQVRIENGPRNPLVVKGPKVLHRPAATARDD